MGFTYVDPSSSSAGAAPAMLLQDVQGELLGMNSPLTIFFLGIGPYINASWTISAIMIVKTPPPLYRHFQSLRRAGREVRSFSHPEYTICLLSVPSARQTFINASRTLMLARTALPLYRHLHFSAPVARRTLSCHPCLG